MKKPLYFDANIVRELYRSPWPRGCGKSTWPRQLHAAMIREQRKRIEDMKEAK